MRSRANRANDGSSAIAQDDFARYHPGVLGRRIVKRLVSWMIVAIGTLVFVGDVFAQERYYEWRWQMHPMWWGEDISGILFSNSYWSYLRIILIAMCKKQIV